MAGSSRHRMKLAYVSNSKHGSISHRWDAKYDLHFHNLDITPWRSPNVRFVCGFWKSGIDLPCVYLAPFGHGSLPTIHGLPAMSRQKSNMCTYSVLLCQQLVDLHKHLTNGTKGDVCLLQKDIAKQWPATSSQSIINRDPQANVSIPKAGRQLL